jgi:hypothetical protein
VSTHTLPAAAARRRAVQAAGHRQRGCATGLNTARRQWAVNAALLSQLRCTAACGVVRCVVPPLPLQRHRRRISISSASLLNTKCTHPPTHPPTNPNRPTHPPTYTYTHTQTHNKPGTHPAGQAGLWARRHWPWQCRGLSQAGPGQAGVRLRRCRRCATKPPTPPPPPPRPRSSRQAAPEPRQPPPPETRKESNKECNTAAAVSAGMR